MTGISALFDSESFRSRARHSVSKCGVAKAPAPRRKINPSAIALALSTASLKSSPERRSSEDQAPIFSLRKAVSSFAATSHPARRTI
jgi:hypothetical protein